ncbi:MAG: HlyD family efflux transporter periplasmic adaptor subunit [Rhodospirillales bacterium]|nr:HlyD family efflux transporter periplasmic adaptor subunit [Rhodospirillales bacterium]
MRWLTRFLLLAGGLGLVAVVIWAFLPSPVEVETAQVRRGRFEESIEQEGQTRVRERYVVAAPLAGLLQRVDLNAGDLVAPGMVVASILPNRAPLLDPRARQEAEQRLGAAEAALARAAAVVAQAQGVADQAQVEADRTRTLVGQGAAPRSRLERDALALNTARRELEAAQLSRHAAEHELEMARAALFLESEAGNPAATWQVRSPVAGRVLRLVQKSESPVALGAPLVEIGNPADLEVIADVLTPDAVRVRPGDPVRITGWGGENSLAGRVRVVEPGAFTKVSALGVDEQRTNIVIDITSPLPAGHSLGDAYRVEARIVTAVLDNAIVVPAGALFRENAGWYVYVAADGRARRRAVSVERRSTTEAAVTQGLSPGERVILFPGETIADGVRIRIR